MENIIEVVELFNGRNEEYNLTLKGLKEFGCTEVIVHDLSGQKEVIGLGGAMASYVGLDPEMNKACKGIIVPEIIKELFPKEQYKALLGHEAGHHAKGHIPYPQRGVPTYFVDSLEAEFEADTYAVSLGSSPKDVAFMLDSVARLMAALAIMTRKHPDMDLTVENIVKIQRETKGFDSGVNALYDAVPQFGLRMERLASM